MEWDLAQSPRDGRGGDGVGLVRGDGAAAVRGAGRCGDRALDRATGCALPGHAVPFRRQLVPGSAGLGRFTEYLELLGLGQRLDHRRGIERATTTYPRALGRALPPVTVVYLISVIPVLALPPWTVWTDGRWPD